MPALAYTRNRATQRNQASVIFGDFQHYPPDDSERALPDAASAVRLLESHCPTVLSRLTAVAERIGSDERGRQAALLATARLARRHGSLGDDFHAYHNEGHVLELAERRLLRMLDALAPGALNAQDLTALMLFAACHDLRQREPSEPEGPIGGNESASIAETLRILACCGFDADADRDMATALVMMIAGSTFDTQPMSPAAAHAADLPVQPGGALARGLGLWLDSHSPYWRQDPAAVRGEQLARLAADLDTGNVGEEFGQLCDTALRLCREREMRAGRGLDDPASAEPCLAFLGPGQQHYFFELHRFSSREGERAFGAGKRANAARVRKTTAALLDRFAAQPPADGQAVLSVFAELAAS